MDIDSPIQSIQRILPDYRKRLNKLGIKTVRDIFYHFPFRYDDFSNIKNIGDLKLNEIATIRGKITKIKNIRTWKKRVYITEAYIQDETGMIKAVWFNQPFLINTLRQDDAVSLAGKVGLDKGLYFSNPAHEKIELKTYNLKLKTNSRHTGGLIPVYPETAGLSSRWLRYIIKLLLPKFLPQIKDHLPDEIKRSQGLLDLDRAIEQIHFPKTKNHASQAKRRLAFDELFLIQLFSLRQKQEWQKQNAPKIKFSQELIKNFVDGLPFKLTDAQRKSAWEILQDLEKSKPMNRLLEGDVGSGKTVVAAIAALSAAHAGYQTALMAPTEILAQQHFKTITELLKDQNISIGLLTGSEAKTCDMLHVTCHKKQEILRLISSGQIQILIGTHALIQERVKFKNLALVVVDEQHRFGVSQRAALQKNITRIDDGQAQTMPHLLSMTATPIPRTLALTIYGDLDISLLDEMPKDRREIITKIVSPQQRQPAYEFIRQQTKTGRQVFVVCPRIERPAAEVVPAFGLQSQWDRDATSPGTACQRQAQLRQQDVRAVKQEYEKLDKLIFPDLKISMLHGKMKSRIKERVMADFKAGKADILVSTSVVEVGVDVPNAAIMMIEGAERFGLAQLHQFKGRVGRSEHQSYCFLFTTSGSDNARLRALAKCKNGFELAEQDLKIRGPGEFFGTQQWGLPDLSMASLSDVALIKSVRQQAQKLIQKDPELKNCLMLTEKLKKSQMQIHLE